MMWFCFYLIFRAHSQADRSRLPVAGCQLEVDEYVSLQNEARFTSPWGLSEWIKSSTEMPLLIDTTSGTRRICSKSWWTSVYYCSNRFNSRRLPVYYLSLWISALVQLQSVLRKTTGLKQPYKLNTARKKKGIKILRSKLWWFVRCGGSLPPNL